MLDTLNPARLAARVTELPPLPEAMVEVMLALGDQNLSAQRSIQLIERDQALAARTLRLANSAFYGMPGRVGNIGDAVRLLGLRTVASVLAAAAVHGVIRVDACPGFHFEAHWRHAIATALAARALAPWAGADGDEAFLAGLMHDVGRLVLAAFHPVEAQRVLALARERGLPAHAAEQAVLGIAHPAIGALVAERWHFPPAIVGAIRRHHDAPAAPVDGQLPALTALVQLANLLAERLLADVPAPPPLPDGAQPLLLALGLGADVLNPLLQSVRQCSDEMTEILRGA